MSMLLVAAALSRARRWQLLPKGGAPAARGHGATRGVLAARARGAAEPHLRRSDRAVGREVLSCVSAGLSIRPHLSRFSLALWLCLSSVCVLSLLSPIRSL